MIATVLMISETAAHSVRLSFLIVPLSSPRIRNREDQEQADGSDENEAGIFSQGSQAKPDADSDDAEIEFVGAACSKIPDAKRNSQENECVDEQVVAKIERLNKDPRIENQNSENQKIKPRRGQKG